MASAKVSLCVLQEDKLCSSKSGDDSELLCSCCYCCCCYCCCCCAVKRFNRHKTKERAGQNARPETRLMHASEQED